MLPRRTMFLPFLIPAVVLAAGCGSVKQSMLGGQKEFMLSGCVPSTVQEFQRRGEQLSEERARRICSCAFDTMQERFKFSEWNLERQAEWMRNLEQKAGEAHDIQEQCIRQEQ